MPPNEKTVQDEIEREDKTFIAGGVIAAIVVLLLLALGIYFLFRRVILPSLRGATEIVVAPSPLPSTSPNDQTPVLRDIDAVPLTWKKTTNDTIGISFSHPPDATLSGDANTLTVETDGAQIVFVKQAYASEDFEDEVNAIRERFDQQDNHSVGLVEETQVAAIPGYTFTVDNEAVTQYFFIKRSSSEYVEIRISGVDAQEGNAAIVDTILKSIEFSAQDSPIEE